MKKIIIAFLFVFVCYMSDSYASTTAYLLSNKSIIEKEEEIEITINIENEKVLAFTSYLYFDNSKLECISKPENTNIVNNKIIDVWYDETGGNNPKQGELAKFIFKAKENGNTSFVLQGEFYNDKDELVDANFEEFQIQIGKEENDVEHITKTENNVVPITNTDNMGSVNTNLETLAIENELLYPPFEEDIMHYDIEISNKTNNLNILAIPQDESATVKIIGGNNLQEGNNEIQVIVTAANGFSQKVYEINVYKRSTEEEVKYEEEQKENKEKLEEIYNAQRTSSEVEMQNKAVDTQNKTKVGIILVVLGIGVLIVIVGLWMKYGKK